MDKNEDRKQDHVNPKVAAFEFTITDGRRAERFRYRDVVFDALTIIKLRNIKRNIIRGEKS